MREKSRMPHSLTSASPAKSAYLSCVGMPPTQQRGEGGRGYRGGGKGVPAVMIRKGGKGYLIITASVGSGGHSYSCGKGGWRKGEKEKRVHSYSCGKNCSNVKNSGLTTSLPFPVNTG